MNAHVTKNERNSNLELFRIITMFFIVAHHYVVNSGLVEVLSLEPMSYKSVFYWIFGAWGKTGINCFVLITGYFMCKSNITIKKFLKLILEVYFYKIIINSIFIISGYIPFSFKYVIKVLLPFTSLESNFTGCYLIFFLFIPFLNILVRNVNEKQHRNLFILVTICFVVLASIPKFKVNLNYVIWFSILYICASYFRLYEKELFNNVKFWGMASLLSITLSILSILVVLVFNQKTQNHLSPYFLLSDSNKLLAFTNGICLFMFFKNTKIKNFRFINAVASTTFGVLLIYANNDAMRQYLWCDLLNNVGYYQSKLFYLHAIISVFVIFIICSAIDYTRIRLVEEPFFRFLDMKYNISKKEIGKTM